MNTRLHNDADWIYTYQGSIFELHEFSCLLFTLILSQLLRANTSSAAVDACPRDRLPLPIWVDHTCTRLGGGAMMSEFQHVGSGRLSPRKIRDLIIDSVFFVDSSEVLRVDKPVQSTKGSHDGTVTLFRFCGFVLVGLFHLMQKFLSD